MLKCTQKGHRGAGEKVFFSSPKGLQSHMVQRALRKRVEYSLRNWKNHSRTNCPFGPLMPGKVEG